VFSSATSQAGCWGNYLAPILTNYLPDFVAQRTHASVQGMIERVAQHQHVALHPLAGAAELGMRKHRHLPITVVHRRYHVGNGVATEIVTLGELIDDGESLGG
jgi:hypothetical protein